MKTRISTTAGAGVLAAALAASGVLATSGPAHAVDSAVITVAVVDQFGQPAPAALVAVDSHGATHSEGGSSILVTSSHTLTGLPADGYSFQVIGPWSGIDCFGASPCVPGGGTTITPVVTVTEGGTASYTAHVTVPTISGGPAVGSPLTIQTSAGYQLIQTLGEQQSHLPGTFTQQWLRGTSDLAGVTALSYTTVPADGGQQVAARLNPAPGVAKVFADAGYSVQPFTTRPVAMSKNATTTKAKFARGKVKVTVTSSPGVVPDGQVQLSLGGFKTLATLKNGKAKVRLPRNIEAGTYKLKVSYPGSATFAASKSKKVKITVR